MQTACHQSICNNDHLFNVDRCAKPQLHQVIWLDFRRRCNGRQADRAGTDMQSRCTGLGCGKRCREWWCTAARALGFWWSPRSPKTSWCCLLLSKGRSQEERKKINTLEQVRKVERGRYSWSSRGFRCRGRSAPASKVRRAASGRDWRPASDQSQSLSMM